MLRTERDLLPCEPVALFFCAISLPFILLLCLSRKDGQSGGASRLGLARISSSRLPDDPGS